MRTKASNQNRFMQFITIPIRALGKARDFYVRIITDYAQRVTYGSAMYIQSGPIHKLSKSYNVSFSSRSSSADNYDLRELIRVASTRRLRVDMDMDMQRQQMWRSTAAGVVPRSCSVRMGRIDEERPCELLWLFHLEVFGISYLMCRTCFGNRSQSKPPRLVLPDELFVNITKSIGAEVNQALGFLQDLACGGNISTTRKCIFGD
ncbi:hypothetical protein CsSME_00013182 [Camellia sinensis var. sinensis]